MKKADKKLVKIGFEDFETETPIHEFDTEVLELQYDTDSKTMSAREFKKISLLKQENKEGPSTVNTTIKFEFICSQYVIIKDLVIV